MKGMPEGNLLFHSKKFHKKREPKWDPEEHNRNAQKLREAKEGIKNDSKTKALEKKKDTYYSGGHASKDVDKAMGKNYFQAKHDRHMEDARNRERQDKQVR